MYLDASEDAKIFLNKPNQVFAISECSQQSVSHEPTANVQTYHMCWSLFNNNLVSIRHTIANG
ncbi:unnamed protein product [Ceratitis capitata]|uniref:(Mediterranean fruit fly) hypothetical protein n=1 Tax=Ceratitis capitata TaxID=7213 RepID=A0A811UWF9_CERCA|nr:unnamed protein product [Ceratitis capitata]